MAQAFARKPGQQSAPVAVAKVDDIRAIRDERTPEEQLLIVLDDGRDEDPGHSVMRAKNGYDKSFVQEARNQLLKIFRVRQ